MDDSFENWLKERTPETDADDGRLSPGIVIGAYHVETFLGKGGFAEVYSAKASNGERVAIKILHRLDEQSRMRFERESHILAQIHHPNTPRLISFGSCGNRPYLVTELLHAEELPHSDRKVAWLVKKVCTAVAALHKLGYAHRDIKPSNILWRDEEPVLIDYGLVCPFSDGPVPPSTLSIVDGRRIVVGTAGYAAPEQFAGGKIDASTDIHAIGMLADACFNGEPINCWRKIIDRATNSRHNARYTTARRFVLNVTMRHAWRHVTMIAVILFGFYNLFVMHWGLSSIECGIGMCHEYLGGKPDVAAKWYINAAKHDTDAWIENHALVKAGDCYANGVGVKTDITIAKKLYTKAVLRKDASAASRLELLVVREREMRKRIAQQEVRELIIKYFY